MVQTVDIVRFDHSNFGIGRPDNLTADIDRLVIRIIDIGLGIRTVIGIDRLGKRTVGTGFHTVDTEGLDKLCLIF